MLVRIVYLLVREQVDGLDDAVAVQHVAAEVVVAGFVYINAGLDDIFEQVRTGGDCHIYAAGDYQFLSKRIFATCKKPGAAGRSAFWVGVV